MANFLFTDGEWSFDLLDKVWQEIEKIAKEEYHLDYFEPQFEIISSEIMMAAYTSSGLPVMYHHWSFGKHFVFTQDRYKRGQMGLAYEIVINSDPSIVYLMEENSMLMQTLVMAHAAAGHGSFFKGNYLFQQWTSPGAIVDYLIFAKKYITECEDKYGYDEVEDFLDSCHALQSYGIDRYKKPRELSPEKEEKRQREREEYLQQRIDDLWKTLPSKKKNKKEEEDKKGVSEPQENILYFIEKNAPLLKPWQREIIRIIRKLAQYFYPQMQTKMINEGWACLCHYHILYSLYDKGLLTEGCVIELLKTHTSVLFQPDWNDKRFTGLNPYYLGFNMFMDIKRMCENPTEEDKKWFPDVAGGDWLEEVTYAMENFKDESFILQYLSPKLIRDMKLFIISDEHDSPMYKVTHIYDDYGYQSIRESLAAQYDIGNQLPNIQVIDFDIEGDRTLFLRHTQNDRVPLSDSVDEMIKHLHKLWGFNILLESYDPSKDTVTEMYGCFNE